MKPVKNLVKVLNKIFTVIILTIFYMILVGICWLVYIISHAIKAPKRGQSYWLEPKNSLRDKNYFSSAF